MVDEVWSLIFVLPLNFDSDCYETGSEWKYGM